jgi:hypothetical protein
MYQVKNQGQDKFKIHFIMKAMPLEKAILDYSSLVRYSGFCRARACRGGVSGMGPLEVGLQLKGPPNEPEDLD